MHFHLEIILPYISPSLHHPVHVIHLLSILHPLFHQLVDLILCQFFLVITVFKNVFEVFICVHLDVWLHSLEFGLFFEGIFLSAFRVNLAELLDLLGVLHQLLVFDGISTVVKLVQELEEFRIAMLGVRRVGKDIHHVSGDVPDRLLALSFLLLSFSLFLDVSCLLDQLRRWLEDRAGHRTSAHHHRVHPWLLE